MRKCIRRLRDKKHGVCNICRVCAVVVKMGTDRLSISAAMRSFLLVLAISLVTCGLLLPCRAQDTSASGGVSPASGSGRGSDGSELPPDGPIPLYFIFLSATSPSINTSGSIPAVDVALQKIDEAGFLAPYTLRYHEALDSRVSLQLHDVYPLYR